MNSMLTWAFLSNNDETFTMSFLLEENKAEQGGEEIQHFTEEGLAPKRGYQKLN